MKVFVSYSHEDRKFAKNLESFLKKSGVQVIDPLDDIRPGNNVFATINRGVEESDLILIFFSGGSDNNEIFSIELDLITSKIVNSSNKRVIPILRSKYVNLPPFIKQFQALTLPSNKDEEYSFHLIRDLIFFRSELEIDKQDVEAEANLIEIREAMLKLEKEDYEAKSKNKATALTTGVTAVIISLLNIVFLAVFVIYKEFGNASYTSSAPVKTVLTPFIIIIIGVALTIGIGIGVVTSLIINNRVRK